jgi:diguanylate cyclase (GGDEF)-like protein
MPFSRLSKLARSCATLALAGALAAAVWPTALATPTSPLRFARLAAFESDELSIPALLQDRQGFVWIGTLSGGLYRHNGYQTVRFNHKAGDARSLPNDRVSVLYEDRNGRLWVGTQEGLARFNPATNDFTRYAPPPGPANQRLVKAIIGDGRDGLWIATWGGLQHFDPASGRFTLHTHRPGDPASLAGNDLNALAMDDHGGLWIATWPGGLDYLAPGATRFEHHRIDRADQPDPRLNIVRSLYFARDRRLWIGTENGVVTWDSGQPWDTRARQPSPANRITYLYGDRNDTIWAATLSAGLLRWDKGARVPVHYVHRASDVHSLPADALRSVMHDRSGMLWVGSHTDGISLVNLNSQGFQRYIPFEVAPDNLRPDNALKAIEGAPQGRLWLSSNSGLALFDPENGEVLRRWRAAPGRPGALSHDIVYSLYQQPGGPLWAGTSAGLHRLDDPSGPFKAIHFGSIGNDFINVIAPGANHMLWLGTGVQVIRYDTRSGHWRALPTDPARPDGRSVNGTTCIVEDARGRVWMGAEWGGGGLDMLDPVTGHFTRLRHDPARADTLADDNVVSLFHDTQGRIWAGTARGLSRIDTQQDGGLRIRNYLGADSVGAVKVLAIRADASGQIWLSTANGLIRLDPDSGHASRYTAVDGLSGGFSSNTAYAAPDGLLYFGGMRGMTGVSPALVRRTSLPPSVAITDISVFNRSLREGPLDGVTLTGAVTEPRALQLAVRDLVFSIEFSGLHYTDPGRNRYAYRLKGFDRDWVSTDAEHRSATYTNLDPGRYLFEVKAANHHGLWSSSVATLPIVILPPWYKTLWFRGLVALGLAAALAGLYHLRVRHLTRRQRELQAMVAERTRELEASNAKLAVLSSTDALTGIANRRGFDEMLEREWERAARNDYPLSLALLDVDHFKTYNDLYGHQAGDDCLRRVAELINARAERTNDLVARYGGEEFALLAPATEADHAHAIAQGICEALAGLAIPHAGSPYGVVSISIGVATIRPAPDKDAHTLVWEADQALYVAKESGRNRAITRQNETSRADAISPL